jgi:hypothetical protein
VETETSLWLALLDALEAAADGDRSPLMAALFFLLVAGAEPVEMDGHVTVVMGRMDLGSWRPEWRSIGHSLLSSVRLALLSLGELL